VTYLSPIIPLHPTAPYDFSLTLAYLQHAPSTIMEQIHDHTYYRAINLDNHLLLITLRSVGTTENPQLHLQIHAPQPITDVMIASAQDWVTKIFQLQINPYPFMEVVRADPVFSELYHSMYGLRPVLMGSPEEALYWAIIGQQINVTFAQKLKRKFIELGGYTLNIEEQIYTLLPDPARIVEIGEETLRAHQFSRQKAHYIVLAAENMRTGNLDFHSLQPFDNEQSLNRLTQHHGIGRWTAEYVMMRGIGARDYIPAADIGLRSIVGKQYQLGRNATEAEVREITRPFTGWRSWVAFYWWMALQMDKVH